MALTVAHEMLVWWKHLQEIPNIHWFCLLGKNVWTN